MPSTLPTAGKASAVLQCPALGTALQERSGLLKTVQRTAVKIIASQKTTLNEPRLKELLLSTLKERRLLERSIYIALPVHGDKTSYVTGNNGLKLKEENQVSCWEKLAEGRGTDTEVGLPQDLIELL